MKWREADAFSGIDLEDSFVLGWCRTADKLVFDLEFSLWPGHPEYEEPKRGEHTCYKHGRLIFRNAQGIQGLLPMKHAPSTQDPNGTIDYGNVERLEWDADGRVSVDGDFGAVRFTSDEPLVEL